MARRIRANAHLIKVGLLDKSFLGHFYFSDNRVYQMEGIEETNAPPTTATDHIVGFEAGRIAAGYSW